MDEVEIEEMTSHPTAILNPTHKISIAHASDVYYWYIQATLSRRPFNP